MHLPHLLRACVATLLVAVSVPLHAAKQQDKAPADLLVSINIPSLIGDTWRHDDVSEVFLSRLFEAFRAQGYAGKIEHDNDAKPAGDQRMIEFHVMEWRVDRVGMITCTFTASVAREGTKPVRLGVFTTSTMRGGTGRIASANAFEESAKDALRDLYRRLQKEGLLVTNKNESKT